MSILLIKNWLPFTLPISKYTFMNFLEVFLIKIPPSQFLHFMDSKIGFM
jgi:hypothetical protein